jgi:hypothetical protein
MNMLALAARNNVRRLELGAEAVSGAVIRKRLSAEANSES